MKKTFFSRLILLSGFSMLCNLCSAQETFSVNGVADVRTGAMAFTNANTVKNNTVTNNATLLIKDGKIIAHGKNISIPPGYEIVDLKGKYVYPSFIDIFSNYGMATPRRETTGFDFNAPAQLTSNTKGAYGWNQAMRSQANASEIFTNNEAQAKGLIDAGFGTVLTHVQDGISRGTGAVTTLSTENDNMAMLRTKAASFFSFNKGTSTQGYPSSLMGSIALLRQNFLDAQWYKNSQKGEGTNLSLQAFNDNLSLPQIFDAGERWNVLRADRIGDEFGVQYIIKADQDTYQRIPEIKNTNATLIFPVSFPEGLDVEDPNDARLVNLTSMKHWEMAPANLGAVSKAGIKFCITSADLKSPKDFLPNLRKAIHYGLPEAEALKALTETPAILLNIFNEVGSLDAGKWANFIIADGPIFNEKTNILQNWVQGRKNTVKDDVTAGIAGMYEIEISNGFNTKKFLAEIKSSNAANILLQDTVASKFYFDGTTVRLAFTEGKKIKNGYKLSGVNYKNEWQGNGTDSLGNAVLWKAKMTRPLEEKKKDTAKKYAIIEGTLTYPNGPYGITSAPAQETVLIKNATVWTSENAGILPNTDVLVKAGKIVEIGKNISGNGATIIDGTGKHLTAGMIDEHSHIAAASINEGGQSVTSEVRIADNIEPDDIDIYRQLSGGVTTSHILHGSANVIGGQTQLIKLRWGANAEDLKFKGSDGFIKFALGENVKRSSSRTNNRFPDTRMGVEQVQWDAFTRAQNYEQALKGPDAKNVRRDLELDALVEIMNEKRFITCHSYVNSEIVQTMRMAEQFGFKINTFTHILEGYKAADKMKAHGAAASTFSDWWAYKLEVQDAIPYNASIMSKAGVNVAINSDDAEMARRLNQEAAKSVKYGGMSEADALKMVTINPAIMLHVQNQTGSIAKGKDADLVLWNDNPLSIYAKAEITMVDGRVYFDRKKDLVSRENIKKERTRLINKMIDEKKAGAPTKPAIPSFRLVNTCDEAGHAHGILDDEGNLEGE